jgi:His/Glu/Gln/Arg/opine family amino acid ABC transporter permease subunit
MAAHSVNVFLAYHFHWEVVSEHLGYMVIGLKYTLALAVSSMAAGLVLGLLVAMARTSSFRPLVAVAYGYTELLRTVPLLLGLFWAYFALPTLLGIRLSAFTAAFIAFTLNLAAFNAEVFRAGLLGVDRGQWEAALSLGMRRRAAFFRIVLPQAARRVIPPLANTWVGLFKDTSIAFVVAVQELTFRGFVVVSDTFRPFEIYTAIALLYFLVTWPQARGVDRLYDRLRTNE